MKECSWKMEGSKKHKKKSVVSQKMKQRKQQEKQKRRTQISFEREFNQEKQSSLEKKSSINQPCIHTEPPELFDHLNYITLEQFESQLEDENILSSYYNAITANNHLFAGKIVLHLTSGCNCFYSIYAAEAAASKVYCVVNGHSLSEQQNIWMMQQIIKENKLQKIIEVISWKDFNAEVDIIIGEPMGFCMHFDGMLDRMVEARDLYLDKNNGVILPDKLKLKCALIIDEHFYDKKVKYWDEVYGITMKSVQNWVTLEPIVKIVDPSLVVSEIHKFIQFDLNTIQYSEIQQIQTQFQLKILQDTEFNGISAWYEIQFNCEGSKSQLKASPWHTPTKFTHVTFYLNKKQRFKAGQKIDIKIYGKKYSNQGMSLIKVSVNNEPERIYTFSD